MGRGIGQGHVRQGCHAALVFRLGAGRAVRGRAMLAAYPSNAMGLGAAATHQGVSLRAWGLFGACHWTPMRD